MKESAVSNHIRLDAAQKGREVWRNNVGACIDDKTGRLIRYGLCNDSKKLNEEIKSSDHIGITPILITPEMVGKYIGVFTAVECKESDWKFYINDKIAVAQLKFIDIVNKAFAIAGFARNVFEYNKIIDDFITKLKS